MIELTATRTIVAWGAGELETARRQLLEAGYVRLPRLVRAPLLDAVLDAIGRASFYRRVHDGIGVEMCADPGPASGVLEFLTNDQILRNAIADLAGCGSIGCFEGRIYRIVPGTDHHDSWHSDVGQDRLLALSINLGVEPFEGGQLQIRDAATQLIIGEVENRVPGDAVLFRIDPRLRHRVASVSGGVSRTAYAGWFRAQPAFAHLLSLRLRDEPSPRPRSLPVS